MPLPTLPPDPKPTEAEIEDAMARIGRPLSYVGRHPAGQRNIERELAVMMWKSERQLADPDAFIVKFATGPFPNGLKNYQEYRRSAEWGRIRGEVLAAARYHCAACEGRATQVHHRDYRPRVLRGEDTRPLVPICVQCHDAIHASPWWEEQEALLIALVSRHEGLVL
jgi:hypothetical protein